MKPDGVATAAMEAMEAAEAESAAEASPAKEKAQPLQTEEVQKAQPEVTPPAEKTKNSKAGEPKAKAKSPAKATGATKTPQKAGPNASTKTSVTSGPSSRPGTAKSRSVNGVQKHPTSNGVAKKADASAPEKKKPTPAPAMAKRPVSAPATSPAKPAEKKAAGATKPSPAASSGAKAAGTPSPNKKALVGPSNGANVKPKTAAPRPASAAPSKPSSVATAKPDKPPVSRTSRSASGAPGARPTPVASTGKPAAASTRPAPSKTSPTAPSTGRTSTGQTKPATPAKKDVSRPTATMAKKPSESVSRPSPAKISKNEPLKLTASKPEATAKRPPSSSKPTEQKPARPAPQESKASASPRSAGSKPGIGKAAVQTPKKAVGSSTPMPVKRAPKPSQSVQSTNVVEESTKENGSENISAPAINPVALAPAPSDSQEVGLGEAPVAKKEEVPEPVEPNLEETKAEVVEMAAPRPESLQDLDSVAGTEEATLALGTTAVSPPSSPPSSTQLDVQSPSLLEEDAQSQDLSESQNQPASVVAPEDSRELEQEHQQDVLLSTTVESVSQETVPSNDLTLSSPAGEHEVAVEKADEEINVDDDDDEDEEKEEEADLQMIRNQPLEEFLEESADPSGYTESNIAPTLEPEGEDVSSSYQELQEEGTHETQRMDESLHEVDDLVSCSGQKQPLTPELDSDNEGMNGSHEEVPEQGPYRVIVEESPDLASFTEQQSDSASGLDGEDDVENSNLETLEQATHETLLMKDSLKESADMGENTQQWHAPVPELKTEDENVYISHPKAPEQGELGPVVVDELLKESTDLASCIELQRTPTPELDTDEEDLHDYHQEEQEQGTHGTFHLEEPLEESSNVVTSGGLHTPTPELDTEDEEVNDSPKEMLEQDSQNKLLIEETLKESSDLTSCLGLQHTPTPEVDTEDEGINDSHPDMLEQVTHRTLLSEEPLNQSADLASYTSLQRTPTPEMDTEDEEVNESRQETECHSPCGTHLMQESEVESTDLATSIEPHHTQVLELDSEDMNNFEQELQDRSVPGLLQSMGSACNMEEGNLEGQEGEPDDALPDNIEIMPEISENDYEDEQDEDIVDDMDLGSDGVEEPCGVLSEKDELNEALEITKEGMLESSTKTEEDVLIKEDHRTDASQDLQLPTAPEDCSHQPPHLPQPAHPADSSSEPDASDLTTEFQPPWLELGVVPQKEDSLCQAVGELDSPVEERDPGAIASVCQPDSLGATELAAHCSSGSETGTPEELVDYDSSSGVESRSEGKQRTPVPPAQPDIEQDLGIHLERGDCEGEEEEAETLPADEILGDPPTAHTSAPSTPSASDDEASDTEGETQMNDPAAHGIDNAAFEGKAAAHDLPALDEGVEGEEDGGTPQSAASAPSYAFDCPTSNAHSTTESCGKSPGLFSLENEDQLPEEAKDPSLVRELTLPAAVGHADLLGTAVDLLPIGQHREGEDEQQEDEDEEQEEEEADQDDDQYLLCGKPGIELPGSLGSAGSMETDLHLSPRHSAVEDPDAQPPYFSAICDKTDNALAGRCKSTSWAQGILQPPPLHQRWCWQLLPQRGSLRRGQSPTQSGTRHPPPDHQIELARQLPRSTTAQSNLQLRRLEQHQLQLEQIQRRQEQEKLKRLKLEVAQQEKERLKRLKLEAEQQEKERLKRMKLEAELQENERLKRLRLEAEQQEKERLKRLKLEAEQREQEWLKRLKLEVEQKEKERQQEQRRLKLEEERQWQEKQRLLKEQRWELLQLQLHHQEHERRQRQLLLQWQQHELEHQQQQQQLKAQNSAILSPSSGLCTIYEAMETSEGEEEEEGRKRMRPSYSVPIGTSSAQRSLHLANSELPSRVTSSTLSCPQLDLHLNNKLEIVQQLINQTLLLAGDSYPPMLLLPGGIGGTLSPLETNLWPTVLPPLSPPSATVTSVSSFSPDSQGRCPQGDWTVVELETHH